MKRKGVNGLAEVFTRQTNEPGVAALELVDGQGRSFAAAIDAHGIVALTNRLLSLASEPVFATSARMASAEQPAQCQADVSHVELRAGRSDSEVVANLTIGCVQLAVFLPRAELLSAVAGLTPTAGASTSGA
jgi:hypothetical protein